MVAWACMVQELYFGPLVSWDLAKGTETVDGKPGHEYNVPCSTCHGNNM